MQQPLYIVLILVMSIACNHSNTSDDNSLVDSITVFSDTLQIKAKNENIERKIVDDSLIFCSDSLFSDLALTFTEISKKEFQSFKGKYKSACGSDSGHFMRGSDLYVDGNCNEICETYLAEGSTNRRMFMPSSYDAGISAVLLSPRCSKFIVCSSYDGPDYVQFYEYRAELFIFSVSTGIGLEGIKPAFKFYSKDWSIEDLSWINDTTIALKIYEGKQGGDGSSIHYKYLKANLNE